MNPQTFSLVQTIFGIIVIVLILLQSKGTGLGSTFGGSGGMYRTKRGAEKMLFYMTIIFSFLFVSLATAGLFL